MTDHPYLRAYMAGVLLPSWFLLVVSAAFLLGHFTGVPLDRLDRAIVFPMAVVPNLWGVWNLLFVALRVGRRVSIGVFGAVLPLLLVPAGAALSSALELNLYSPSRVALLLPIAMCLYYLAWKYAVTFFNRVVGLR